MHANLTYTTLKTMFLQSFVVLYVMFSCINANAETPDKCAAFFDSNGVATQKLVDLFAIMKIQDHKDIYNVYNSLEEIKKWRIHPGVERWNLKLPNNLKNNARGIINICENKFGMKEEVLPKNIKYSGVLFLGATLSRVVDRVGFYHKLVNGKILDKKLKIWVLTGERELDEKAGETKENFLKLVPYGQKPLPLPTNELGMIKFVFYYLMPKEIDIEYIYSAKDPNHTRATTASTTYTWAEKIQQSLQKSYYVGISNQPYVDYQELVMNIALQKIGKKNIVVQVVGSEVSQIEDHDNYAAILLDTVSKTISSCNEEFIYKNRCDATKLCGECNK
jgi:hypothetical protein